MGYKEFNTQVCIIGAGPAGLTASLFLSKFGIAHIVVDKSYFPRDKVCGECYSLHLTGTKLVVNFPRDNRPKLLSKRLDFDH